MTQASLKPQIETVEVTVPRQGARPTAGRSAEQRATPKAKVAAVVINSVSHDARVTKEAESLSRAGYEVTLIGIRDNRDNEPQGTLPHGTSIRRVFWQPLRELRLMRICQIFAWSTFALSILLAIGLVAAFEPLKALFSGLPAWVMILVQATWHHLGTVVMTIVLATIVGLSFVSAYRLNQLARHHGQIYRNLLNGRPERHRKRRRGWTLIPRMVAREYAITGAIHQEIDRQLEQVKPDIVHCHDLTSLPIGVRYKLRSPDCQLVYDSHEIFEEITSVTSLQRCLHRRTQRRCSRHVNAFITVNPSIGRYLGQEYPDLPAAAIVMNATLPANDRTPYDGRLHDAAGLSHDVRILLYQGGFSAFRGLEKLVTAAALLPEGWALVMMGWGALEDKLHAISNETDPERLKTRFIPAAPQEELPQWSRGGTLGVIPYENVCLNHWYCSPNKIWEYPNAGLPILASPFPELERIVVHEGIGWLLSDPLTPQVIADRVAAVSDKELAEKKANCARFIRKDNWAVYEKRLLETFEGVATAQRKSPRG